MCFLTIFFSDYDECIDYNYHCPADSHCINSDGSYTCKCNKGFRLDANKDCEGLLILTINRYNN